MSKLKEEYDRYMAEFDKRKGALVSDSGDLVSNVLMVVEGISFRVGQILADLEIEYLENFDKTKKDEVTEKVAKARCELKIRDNHGVSKMHFENMQKSFSSMIMSLKKRLRVLEAERTY